MLNLILKLVRKVYRIIKQYKCFSSNSLANIDFLNTGIVDRRENKIDEYHKNVINRLISSYHKAKNEQRTVPLPYQPGGAWKEDIETRRAEFLNALNSNDFESLSNLLTNFFRNNGLAGVWCYGYYNDIVKASNNKKRWFINNILRDYRTLIDFVDGFDVANLSVPKIGNPWGYIIKGTLVLPTACRHYYLASHVKNLIGDIKEPVICEIGGGFGGFAYYVLSIDRSIKYINFDLPEVLLIAQYFLMKAFPDKKFLLFGENGYHKICEETIKNYDIILMPNFALPDLGDRTADLFINTGSLSEMDYHTVEEYVNQIARITKTYFFHENSDRPSLINFGHIEVMSSKFPIPLDTFKRIYKNNSLWGGAGGRHREHLYQRKKA